MTIESTRGLSAWSRFWILAVIVAVGAACSGGSKSSGPPTSARRGGSGGSTPATAPRTTPGTTPRTMPNQPVVFVPGYIDATGKTDVSTALQKFIDQLKNGRTVKFHR